jgi:integrase/recombinase XerD
MVTSFKKQLQRENLSHNTIIAYMYAVEDYLKKYSSINKQNLLLYKAEQMERFKPKTVNLRIQALNRYLMFIGKPRLRLKSLKIQQKSYLEHVISNADYSFLKTKLKEEDNEMWYFLVRFLGATGARVSELIEFKAEHVRLGYFDIYTKGGKVRRLFIPKGLNKETAAWLEKNNRSSGHLFLDRHGKQITPRAIRHKLQGFAIRWGINPKVMHPHSFRHRYAKNFLEAFNDIALLADLMGHESIETTRIYLRRTAGEQQAIVDRVITW